MLVMEEQKKGREIVIMVDKKNNLCNLKKNTRQQENTDPKYGFEIRKNGCLATEQAEIKTNEENMKKKKKKKFNEYQVKWLECTQMQPVPLCWLSV